MTFLEYNFRKEVPTTAASLFARELDEAGVTVFNFGIGKKPQHHLRFFFLKTFQSNRAPIITEISEAPIGYVKMPCSI